MVALVLIMVALALNTLGLVFSSSSSSRAFFVRSFVVALSLRFDLSGIDSFD
jgi:hypothetical protein